MDKTAFLTSLRAGLNGLPQEDIEERVNFYSEMIDDYVEEGLSEDEAIGRIGPVREIAAQIIADSPLSKPLAETAKPAKKRRGWQITLIVLGSPIWFALLISAFAVVFSVFVALWAIVVSIWAVFACLCCCGVAGIVCGIGLIIGGYWQSGLAMIGAGLVLTGLSILALYGCRGITKAMVWLTRKSVRGIKNRLKKKEEA